jgi:hypothetical protein
MDKFPKVTNKEKDGENRASPCSVSSFQIKGNSEKNEMGILK